ncbi:MAG: glycosyltransferase family 2 protein [Anaerolineales bacterium]|nr:glycosyltransferase family 2 protein [Anaerolineales bacterium]
MSADAASARPSSVGVAGLASIIIPNWNGSAHLPTCLRALARQTYPHAEVLLVDNASTDDSLALVARDFPQVRILAQARNLGFTGACNAGLRAARGEILILLNNDTEAAPDWLAEVMAAFARYPNAGSIASKMLLFDRRDTLHAAGDLFRRDGMPGNRGVWQTDTGQYAEGPVFSANGGSAAYRRALLDDVGLLDDAFYFSLEDVDLGWRAQLRGWACIYAPRAVVYHKLSATGGGVTHSYYNGRNFLYVLAKDVPGELWRKYWPRMLGAQLRISWDALRAWRGQEARARLRGQLAGLLRFSAMLRARRPIQARRTAPLAALEGLLDD